MYEQFVDRTRELVFLEKAYQSDRGELIVVYGRRRVGKTELLKKSIINSQGIYFLAEETVPDENLKEFRKQIAEYLENPLIERTNLTWEELFELLAKEKAIIIIDEFPNLVKSRPGIISKFQKIWDELLSKTETKLLLLGSSVSVMENEVLGYKSPLYGRRTGQIELTPLDFFYLKEFFPEKTWEQLVQIYGITDGIPAYIKEVQFRLKAGERLEDTFIPNTYLFDEANFSLRVELREPARYFQILKTIALGNTTFGEIVSYSNFASSTVSKYLSNLKMLRFVSEEHPTGQKEKRRNARYSLSDNYIHFYFKFIYPNKLSLEETGEIPNFQRDYNTYLGKVFEKIAKQFLLRLRRKRVLAFNELGRWWHKDLEIDLIAISETETYFFEVKWSDLSERDARKVLRKLESKITIGNFKGTKQYGLIGKRIAKKEQLRSDYLVWDLEDL